MSGRGIIGSAVALYLLVLGCVLWPDQSSGEKAPTANPARLASMTPAGAKDVLPLRGVALQIQRVDWVGKYKKSIDEIADLGADTVSLVVDTRQRSEERRVGKECRSRWSPYRQKKKVVS